MTFDDYIENIGFKVRFKTVKKLSERYREHKEELIKELKNLKNDEKKGRYKLISILYQIYAGKANKLHASIINELLNGNRLKIKTIINRIMKHYRRVNINQVNG